MAYAVLGRPAMAMPSAVPRSWRKVLLVIEDRALSDVLAEALVDAGHVATQVEDAATAQRALDSEPYDVAIVDLDTRARDGVHLIARLRAQRPALTIIALLPCGGLPSGAATPGHHLAIEKPARLSAVLSAVNVAHAAIRN
ncbi:MAG: DNA-binding response regulator [bacterium]|nr:DNA-binding response regulator [bacterium]